MTFSRDDIHVVNALNHIRSHRKRYLRTDGSLGEELAGKLIADILVIPYQIAHAVHVDDWWVVASNKDWIPSEAFASIKEYFEQIVPFPEAGPNSMHAEVLITAFATDVVTFGESGECIVRGASDAVISNLVHKHPDWKRIVAFRV